MKYFVFITINHPARFIVGKGATASQVIRQAEQCGVMVVQESGHEMPYSERYSCAGHIDVDLLPGCRAENGMIV